MGFIYSSDPDFEMKKNNILPIFLNYFNSIKQDESPHRISKLKLEANELLNGVSEIIGVKNLQYYVLTGNNDKMKSFFTEKIKELTLHVKKRVELSDEQKVENQIRHLYYDCDSIPFRTLYNNISTIYQFIRPVAPAFDILRFYKQLFRQVNFETLSDTYSKENIFEVIECPLTISEGLEALRKIYTNLSHCKDDINAAINHWQLNIAQLTAEEINSVKNHLVSTLGSLKIQTKANIPGTDFYKRFDQISTSLKKQDRLRDIDYQMLILSFAEVMGNDLIGTFEIIIQSLNQITPKTKSPKDSESTNGPSESKLSAPVIGLFCFILNDCGHVLRSDDESNQVYCQRVCKMYNLPYTERVRQTYSGSGLKTYKSRIIELILPLVDQNTSTAIAEYLSKK